MRRAPRLLSVIACLTGLASSIAAKAEPPPLSDVLRRMANVASLYRDAALRFSCGEKITYWNMRTGVVGIDTLRFHYLYSYTEEGTLRDLRREREPAGEIGKEVDLADYDLPLYVLRPYVWMLMFDRKYEGNYRFSLDGLDKALGRKGIRLRFEPVPPWQPDVNDWYGTILVDRETYQPLIVEAVPVFAHEMRELLKRFALRQSPEFFYPFVSLGLFSYPRRLPVVETKFGLVKNGMRFPSRVEITQYSYQVLPHYEEAANFRVLQAYKDYEFFRVRTQAEIREIVGH